MSLSDPTANIDVSMYRSTAVLLLNETLARAHSRTLQMEAEQERIAHELRVSRRMQRRADRAARRARKLADRAIVVRTKVS